MIKTKSCLDLILLMRRQLETIENKRLKGQLISLTKKNELHDFQVDKIEKRLMILDELQGKT